MKWFTLWIYSSVAFTIGPVPMTPGWWAALSFPPPLAQEQCNTMRRERSVDTCLAAGEEPIPLARMIVVEPERR